MTGNESMGENAQETIARGTRHARMPTVVLLAVVAAAYLPALRVYFMGDDFEWLNAAFQAFRHPLALFQPINNFYRPLVKLSYLVDRILFGTSAPAFAATTLGFHLVNVVALHALLRRCFATRLPAALAVLFFGLSPLYSEVTLWSAGRPDSMVLAFMLASMLALDSSAERPGHRMLALLPACGAALSKETWVVLPVLAAAFLVVVRREPVGRALRSTWGLFAMAGVYIVLRLGLPLLRGTSSPLGYATTDLFSAARKCLYLLAKYLGAAAVYSEAPWQAIAIVAFFVAAIIWMALTGNRVGLFGLLWMAAAMAPSATIAYAPSRYNYLPLMGFWIAVAAAVENVRGRLHLRTPAARRLILTSMGVLGVLVLAQQVIMLQWEIADYRRHGELHREVVAMYRLVRAAVPSDHAVVFVNAGTRRAVEESSETVHGYRKLFFVRADAIWQMIELAPLANFCGDPSRLLLEPAPAESTDSVVRGEFTVLVFTDAGFSVAPALEPRLRDFFRREGTLPQRTRAFRFNVTRPSPPLPRVGGM